MFLLRKLNMKWWPENDNYDCISYIPAEPISRDMNSTANTFSLWKFGEDEICEGALTMLLNDSGARIDTTDVVCIDEEDIIALGLELSNEKSGDTKYIKNKDKHYDIINMNHESLGKVADVIIKSITKERLITIEQAELLDLLKEKINNSEIEIDTLNKAIRKQIE